MNRRVIMAFLALMISGGGAVADAAEVKIICANGMRDTVRGLHDQLESTTGHKVTMTFGEAGNLRRGLQGGDVGDVIILPRTVMDQALADGKIAPGTTVDLARTEIGAGVLAAAAKSDMTSADGFKRALLAATAIVITDPASGGVSSVHMADVFQRLGIAAQIKPKLKLNTGGYNAEFVAKGEADIAFQLANEIRAVPGIAFLPLPAEYQRVFVFSAALGTAAKDSAPANAVIQFLSGPAGAAGIRAKRLEPLASQ
jgi:molybdate transport system substrate-binding protein